MRPNVLGPLFDHRTPLLDIPPMIVFKRF